MSRSIRLLNLLQQLRESRYPVTAQVLAERLGISIRSIYRDIDSLRAQGVRIDASAGLGFQLKETFYYHRLLLMRMKPRLYFSFRVVERRSRSGNEIGSCFNLF